MKRFPVAVAVATFLVAGLAAAPASAQAAKEYTCSEQVGSNTLTYDCGFRVKDVVVGSPITFTVNYSCSGGACGPVLSFGLGSEGFTPAGLVAGHMVGGRRVSGGLELSFVFDELRKTGNHEKGEANFMMSLMVDDGAGNRSVMPCAVRVRLKSEKEEK